MIIRNTKMLADQLKADTLPEKEVLKYYALLAILTIVNFGGSDLGERFNHPVYLIYENLINIAWVLLTIYIPYRWNQRGDGKNFITRDVCLSIPITVNLLLFTIIALIPFGIVMVLLREIFIKDINPSKFLVTEFVGISLFTLAIYAIYILYCVKWFRYVSGENEDLNAMEKSNYKRSAMIAVVAFVTIFFVALAESKGAFKNFGGYDPQTEIEIPAE